MVAAKVCRVGEGEENERFDDAKPEDDNGKARNLNVFDEDEAKTISSSPASACLLDHRHGKQWQVIYIW